jgi:hypothetical protein
MTTEIFFFFTVMFLSLFSGTDTCADTVHAQTAAWYNLVGLHACQTLHGTS